MSHIFASIACAAAGLVISLWWSEFSKRFKGETDTEVNNEG